MGWSASPRRCPACSRDERAREITQVTALPWSQSRGNSARLRGLSNGAIAGLGGVMLGSLALAAEFRAKTSTDLAIAAVVGGIVCVVSGNPRRFLLAIMVFDIPLEWGKYLSWNATYSNVGAIAGLDI